MKVASGLTWTTDEITPRLSEIQARLEAGIFAVMSFNSSRVESHAKANAGWTDRTANARNALSAQAYSTGKVQGIVLYHQMPYGIWLEVRWGGRYAIILPTIELFGPQIMAQIRGLLGNL